MNKVEKLYDTLKKIQEAKGYFFNRDKELVFELLSALIFNKKRYDYMSCPCRLAWGNIELDKDILCPCVYRNPDIEEYGSCYCNLYVSKAWNNDQVNHVYIPERRPPEKIGY